MTLGPVFEVDVRTSLTFNLDFSVKEVMEAMVVLVQSLVLVHNELRGLFRRVEVFLLN